jgi:hypothetical protein
MGFLLPGACGQLVIEASSRKGAGCGSNGSGPQQTSTDIEDLVQQRGNSRTAAAVG